MQTTGHQKLFNFINAALDWCVLVVSYLLSVYIRQGLMFGITNPALLLEDHYIPMALVYSTLMVGVLIFLNMYGSYRFRSFWKETVSLAMANGFGVVALGFVLYFLKMGDFARWQVAFLLAFSVVGLVGKRAVLRALLRAGCAELWGGGAQPPARVVINEYLDIAHGFFGGEEPRFANGVLDAVARDLRPEEFAGADRRLGT